MASSSRMIRLLWHLHRLISHSDSSPIGKRAKRDQVDARKRAAIVRWDLELRRRIARLTVRWTVQIRTLMRPQVSSRPSRRPVRRTSLLLLRDAVRWALVLVVAALRVSVVRLLVFALVVGLIGEGLVGPVVLGG